MPRTPRMLAAAAIAVATIIPFSTAPAAAQQPAAQCDINGDGRADLAIGVPREDLGGVRGAGGVHVFYGDNDRSLNPVGDDLWNQSDGGVAAHLGQADQFGSATACADFDADGFADLAVGVPGETIGGERAGAVQVLYGSDRGLTTRDQLWHQDQEGVKGGAEEDDQFGSAVAAADFDGDGFPDLAVGVPGEDIGGENAAGAVQVLYGSRSGVTARDNLWHQDDRDIVANAGARNFFGADVAGGDFDGDGYADLAVGVPGEGLEGAGDAGAVHVLYGSVNGLTTIDELWHQGDRGIQGGPETDDRFGSAVGAADFDADDADDLIVGIPGEDIGGVRDSGSVQVVYGSSNGLTRNDDLWHQNDRGIAAKTGDSDQFGASVDAGDFDGDGHADLAVGVVGEILAGNDEAGAVHVLYGGDNGVTRRDQLWHQNDDGVDGGAERGDLFGFDLFSADFDGDGSDDLAVGVGGEGIGGSDRAGAVQTLYGGGQFLTSVGELWHQADRGVAGGPERGDNMGWALP